MPESRLLGAVGVVGCAAFVVVVAILTVVQWSSLRDRGWDPIRSSDVPYPSTLALGSLGWLQVLNFAILGLSVLAIAVGLWRVLEPPPTAPLVLLAIAGLAGMGLMATTDGSLSAVRTWHGAVHVGAFFTLLIALLLAMLLFGLTIAEQPTWAWLRPPSITIAVLVVVLTAGSFVVPALGGLASVLSIAAMLVWLVLIGSALSAGP
jgi:hypothetical protein